MATRNQKVGAGALAGSALAIAISLVQPWEGRETTAITTPDGKRYVAYQDIIGVWTACDGITRGVKPGGQYTTAQCDAALAPELQLANSYIDRCITVAISNQERGAYVSGGYNLGPQLVCGSNLQRKLNAGDHEGACRELPRWNKAGGREVRGLTNRRIAEMNVCLSGLGK
jgi:GH24 family phage-related lysozyme (muramidase)